MRNNKGQFVKGNKHSDEMKKKISDSLKGRVVWNKGITYSDEYKQKLSIAHMGKSGYWQGKHMPEEMRKKIGEGNLGKIMSIESRRKMSKSRTGEKNPMYGVHLCGELSGSWKGGITPIAQKIRNSNQTKDWRISVFNRDDYTCQFCHDRSRKGHSVILHAHHIKSFADFPEDRFNVENGITLCKDCHYYVHRIDILSQQ